MGSVNCNCLTARNELTNNKTSNEYVLDPHENKKLGFSDTTYKFNATGTANDKNPSNYTLNLSTDHHTSYAETIQANWKGHKVRAKYKQVKNNMKCPGMELTDNNSTIHVNKNVDRVEKLIGPFSISALKDSTLKDYTYNKTTSKDYTYNKTTSKDYTYNNSNNNKDKDKDKDNNSNHINTLSYHSILYPDNTIYLGNYDINWNRTGNGTQYFPDGCKYTGEFYQDKMCGKGRIIYPEGDYYEGDFLNDKAHGIGKFVYNQGLVYKGNWKNDSKCGYGEETNKDRSFYKGNHENDMKHGKGIFTWSDGSSYIGDFNNNIIEGFGRILYADGNIYIGGWKAGKIDGFGIFSWPDYKCFIGNYKADKKNGFGILILNDDKKFHNNWVNGLQHGYGMYNINDKIKIGEWRMGKKLRWTDSNTDEEVSKELNRNIEMVIESLEKSAMGGFMPVSCEDIRRMVIEKEIKII